MSIGVVLGAVTASYVTIKLLDKERRRYKRSRKKVRRSKKRK